MTRSVNVEYKQEVLGRDPRKAHKIVCECEKRMTNISDIIIILLS